MSQAERGLRWSGRARKGALTPRLEALGQPLIWLHSDNARGAQRLEALSHLALRECAGCSVLLTHPAGVAPLPDLPGRVALALGADDGAFARLLLSHQAPVLFLAISEVIPAAIIAALRGGPTRVCLAGGEGPGRVSGWRGLPGLLRPTLAQIHRVFLPRDDLRPDWRAAGLREEALITSGQIAAIPAAPGCNEAERDALSEAFRHRALWCAVEVPEREEAAVLAAHREALRDSHRLALILHPAEAHRGAALRDELASQFSTALRSQDHPVTPETQIYIADTEGERGLWFRLAVVGYVGGSLGGDGARVSPLEAAALGCAVVHGRMFGQHAEAFDLLRAARATRMVQAPEALGPAIGAALRPEQAAEMAHRGWQVIAEGAAATETVMAELRAACAGAP